MSMDDLIARLERGEGEDRQLDLAIVDAFALVPGGRVPLPWLHCYTTSLDAAGAFVGRALPDFWWGVHQMGVDNFDAEIWGNGRETKSAAGSAARALMAAALKAYQLEKMVGDTGIEPVTSPV